MAIGWIKLSRNIEKCPFWNEKPFSRGQAWVDLILLANHKDYKAVYRGNLIECKRGDVDRSMQFLSERWGWTWRRVKHFIEMLESDGMVHINSTTKRTIITIENYAKWQDEAETDSTTDSKQTAQQKAQRTRM